MINQQRIGKLLGIRDDEVPKIMIIIGTSFFIGMSLFFYYIGASAIFLAEYSETALPYVYILNAIIVIIAGAAYSYVSNILPITVRVYISSFVLASGGLVVWLAYVATESPEVIFLMLVWYRVLLVFGMIDGWELMGAVFNVHQAKRLFALSQLGVMLGMITAALVGGVIAPLVSTSNLLLISWMILFVYLGLQIRYVPRLGPFNLEQAKDSEDPVGIRALFGNRYILLLFALKIVLVVSLTLVEYLYSQQAVLNFESEQEIASFFGLAFGLSMIVNIFLVGLVSGRFIARFGIRVALLGTPILIVLVGAIELLIGVMFGVDGLGFFIGAVSLMFIMWTMPYVLAAPAQNILMQPLPTKLRTATRVAVEGGLGSSALIVSGFLILVFSQLGDNIPIIILALLLTTAVLWLTVVVVTFRLYAQKLTEAVSLHFMQGIDFDIASESDLFEALSSNHADDIRASLALISDTDRLAPMYADLLKHSDEMIQRDVLRRLAKNPQESLRKPIQDIATSAQNSNNLRADALNAWASVDMQSALHYAHARLPDEQGLTADRLAIILASDSSYQAQALKYLDNLSSERQAEILGEFPPGIADKRLVNLLDSNDKVTVRQAIDSVSSAHPEALQKVLSMFLTDRRYISAVVASLKNEGDRILPQLEAMLASPTERHKSGVIRLLGAIGSEEAQTILAKYLQIEKAWELRHTIIRALHQSGYQTQPSEAIPGEIDSRIEILNNILNYRSFAEANQLAYVSSALKFDYHRTLEDVIILCSFIYPREVLLGILHRLQHGQGEIEGDSLEALELTLPKERARNLFPLLDKNILDRPQDNEVNLAEIIYQDEEGWASVWTRACVVRAIADEVKTSPLDAPIDDQDSALLQQVLSDHMGRTYRQTWLYKISEFTEETLDEIAEEQLMLTTLEKFAILRELDLFEQVPDPILGELALELKQQKSNAGETILRKGDIGDALYIVAEGELIAHSDEAQSNILATMERGGIVGEFAVLDAEPRSAFVTTTQPTTLLVLQQSVLYELMTIYPEIIRGIMKSLVQKLRATKD